MLQSFSFSDFVGRDYISKATVSEHDIRCWTEVLSVARPQAVKEMICNAP